MQNITEEQIKTLEEQKVELDKDINSKHERIDVLVATINDLALKEKSFVDNTKEAKEIEEHVATLAVTRDELQKTVDSLKAKIDEIERVGKTLDSQKKQIAEDAKTISENETKKKNLTGEVALAKAVVLSLENDALTMRKNHEIERETHKETHAKTRSDADAEIAIKKGDIATVSISLLNLKNDFSVATQKLVDINAELEKKNKDLETFRSDISQLSIERDSLSRLIVEAYGAKESELNAFKEKLDLQQKDLEVRESDLSFRQDIVEKRADTLRDVKNQLEQIHGKKINIVI